MAEGRVTVNGEVVTAMGSLVDPVRDKVEVDGRRVRPPTGNVYVMLNKPVGVVSTARDPEGRQTVLDLVPSHRRLFPVGRLDYDSAGLILLTDDGELSLRLTHPRYGIERTYLVDVQGDVTPDKTQALRAGVRLEDGVTAPARVKVLKRSRGGGVLELTLSEGRNREVRRMCGAVGLRVTSLVRTRFGPLEVKGLRPGAHRLLNADEIAAVREAVALTEARE